jgi:alkyldihydroxyacetonephosphate synthase
VVWPAHEEDVQSVVRFCGENDVPVVPYGAGSGVCGGTVPVRGGVVMDMKRLNRVLDIDLESRIVHAEAGILGQHLEEALNREGFTLGHYPSSIMCSTLGGWLATRSAGQMSSRYGKIEDMVLSLRAVSGSGEILDTADRGPGEPDWTQLLVGSEGTLGVLSSARLRIHPVPTTRWLRGYRFHHLADGIQGMRQVMQTGLQPAVLRLYDPFDTLVSSGNLGPGVRKQGEDRGTGALGRGMRLGQAALRRIKNRALTTTLALPGVLNRLADLAPTACMMVIAFEGTPETVEPQVETAQRILEGAGGTDAGPEPGERWLANRYEVSFKQSPLFAAGAFSDTMEVAVTWDRLETLYSRVREAVSAHVFVMAHLSHAYREGCGIYFSFVGYRPSASSLEALYDRVWESALEAVKEVGATVSHHHGVGLLKRDAMPYQHGEMLRVWRVLKDVLDPHGIMNPGKLFPDDDPEEDSP